MQSDTSSARGELERGLESALQDLGFAVKSLQLYPPSSPVVKEAVNRTFSSVGPLIGRQAIALDVTPGALRCGDVTVDAKGVVEQLARRLHGHGVARLHLSSGLKAESLQQLAELVATERRLLDERGGFRAAFDESRPSGIDADFLDLEQLFREEGSEAVEDIWEALLDGFVLDTDAEDIDWETLANNLERLQDYVSWVADNVDQIAERTGYENIDVFRFVLERIGSIAASLSAEHVHFLVLAVRRIFDQVDPETLVELLAEPLEVEADDDADPDRVAKGSAWDLAGPDPAVGGVGAAHDGKRTIDITHVIACGLEPSQAEKLILHAMQTRETSSTRLYGLFSRLMDRGDERVPVARRVQSFLEEQSASSDNGESFLNLWPRLSEVLEGEAPERFVSRGYEMTLQRLLQDDTLGHVWPAEMIRGRLHELKQDFIARRKVLVLGEILEAEETAEVYAQLAAEVESGLPVLVAAGDYNIALVLLRILSRHASESSDKTAEQRATAAAVLERFYAPATLRHLLADTQGRPEVEENLIIEIIELGGTRIVPALFDTLADEDDRWVRMRLLKILRALGAAASNVAAARLEDRRWYVIRNLLLIVGESGDASYVDKVAPHLQHRDPRVRRPAVETIVRLGGPRAPELLIAATGDDDEAVRLAAVHGLGFRGSESGVATLRTLLELPNLRGQNTATIRTAAIALGRLTDKESGPPLERLAKRPWIMAGRRRPAQEAAVWALRALRGERIGPPPDPGAPRGMRPTKPGRRQRG